MFRKKKRASAETKHIAALTRSVFGPGAELGGKKMADIKDNVLVGTPEATAVMMIDAFFATRFHDARLDDSDLRLFVTVLKMRGLQMDEMKQILGSAKGKTLEFLIEAALRHDGFAHPNVQELEALVVSYNELYPEFGNRDQTA